MQCIQNFVSYVVFNKGFPELEDDINQLDSVQLQPINSTVGLVAMDESDAALGGWISRIGDGDEDALASFYDATLGNCYGLALRIVRDPGIAEDVVAETYWHVWRNAGQYDAQRGAPTAWLLTICRSRAIDQLRKQDQASSYAQPEELGAGMVDHDDPSALLIAMQDSSVLKQALQGLAETPRQVLGLSFYQGLTHQEISDHMGLPLGTVKSHLRRGQKCVRDAMHAVTN